MPRGLATGARGATRAPISWSLQLLFGGGGQGGLKRGISRDLVNDHGPHGIIFKATYFPTPRVSKA